MRLPTLKGIIKRRILVNYCAEPEVVQNLLPKGFRPKLHKNKAIVGICLIRLENMHPRFTPEFIGVNSENAAHRIAVLWEDENGETKEGVYIPRRDTGSFINSLVGGMLFPGEQNKADFKVTEKADEIDFSMKSDDDTVCVKLNGTISEEFPKNSVFDSLNDASKFFEKGALGYSVTESGDELDGIVLEVKNWSVKPLDVEFVESSFYDDEKIFPKGSVKFDHALLMQNIEHEWHSVPSYKIK